MFKTGKSQLIYLLRMLEYCGKIRVYLQGFTNHNDFYNKSEQLYFNASLTLLVQLGEQAARIDESLKEKAAGLPWPMIKGFRNIVVHEYQYVDAEKVYQVCTVHIPLLQNNLEEFIRESVKNNLLSDFELKLSKGSEFYSHVRFENIENVI
jgi:uncharacterized protein with HEPN domain